MTAADDQAFVHALGLRVRVLRAGRRLSQEHLATACGLSRVAVSNLETGAHAPNILTLRRLATALDVSLTTFVDEESTDPLRLARLAGSDSRPAPRRR